MGRSVSGAGNSRRLNDEHAVPTIRFARPRSNSLAAIAPARVASSICANSVLLRAQSLWVLFLLPPPQPSPARGTMYLTERVFSGSLKNIGDYHDLRPD